MALALTVIFWCLVGALAVIGAAGALILADVFLLSRWWPSRVFAPICAVLGHTDEEIDEVEPQFGVCARCGTVFWPPVG